MGAWIPVLHSRYRSAICREPRHDGPRAPHCSLPSSTNPGLPQASGQLQHGSPGGGGSRGNKDLTLRLGVGIWPRKESRGAVPRQGQGYGQFRGEERGRQTSAPLTVQHGLRVEKGSGCCQPGWDTLFPRPHAHPCPPLFQDRQEKQS